MLGTRKDSRTNIDPVCFLDEKPSTNTAVDSGASLLIVPDPFGLELSDTPGV